MDETELKNLAGQLRKPTGKDGLVTGERMFLHNGNMIRRAITLLQLSQGQKILEMGFGNGAHLDYLFSSAEDLRYTGIDISETMAEEASNRNQERVKSGKARFLLTNGIDIPLSDGAFEKFFTVNTIYFWEDHSAVLKEISRVLKPGGIACIALASKNFMEKLPFVKYGFQLFSPEEIKTLVGKELKVLEVKIENDDVKTDSQETMVREIIYVLAEK